MPFPAEEVITAARDIHPTFDIRRTPDALLLRRLTNYARDLVAAGARVNKRVMTTDLVVTLATYDFAAGAVIPDNLGVMNGKALTSQQNAEIPFTLIEPGLRLGRTHPFPCGWVENLTTLRLVGLAVDWASIVSVTVPYIANPATLTALNSSILLPLAAKAALTADLAAFMAARLNGQPGVQSIPVSGLQDNARQAYQTFLDSLGARRVGKVFQVQDGY